MSALVLAIGSWIMLSVVATPFIGPNEWGCHHRQHNPATDCQNERRHGPLIASRAFVTRDLQAMMAGGVLIRRKTMPESRVRGDQRARALDRLIPTY